ncbi:hypothetical protein HOY80DRAFT_1001236 [Tuber brumale]|nr:hypothetical protein HOY80DRAFT_1001236 [Tuber brumale]
MRWPTAPDFNSPGPVVTSHPSIHIVEYERMVLLRKQSINSCGLGARKSQTVLLNPTSIVRSQFEKGAARPPVIIVQSPESLPTGHMLDISQESFPMIKASEGYLGRGWMGKFAPPSGGIMWSPDGKERYFWWGDELDYGADDSLYCSDQDSDISDEESEEGDSDWDDVEEQEDEEDEVDDDEDGEESNENEGHEEYGPVKLSSGLLKSNPEPSNLSFAMTHNLSPSSPTVDRVDWWDQVERPPELLRVETKNPSYAPGAQFPATRFGTPNPPLLAEWWQQRR